METRLTKRCLVFGWAKTLASVKTKKKMDAAQGGSELDNIMNDRRQPSESR